MVPEGTHHPGYRPVVPHEFSADVPFEHPSLPAEVLAAVRTESQRLLELESLVGSVVPLPDGWHWRSRLHVRPCAGSWLVRATLVPEMLDP